MNYNLFQCGKKYETEKTQNNRGNNKRKQPSKQKVNYLPNESLILTATEYESANPDEHGGMIPINLFFFSGLF